MARAVPLEMRRRIVGAYLAGEGSYDGIAARFKVSTATVARLLRQHRATGDLRPGQAKGGNPARLGPADIDQLRLLVERDPAATVSGLADAWGRETGRAVSRSAMQRALHRLGLAKAMQGAAGGPPRQLSRRAHPRRPG